MILENLKEDLRQNFNISYYEEAETNTGNNYYYFEIDGEVAFNVFILKKDKELHIIKNYWTDTEEKVEYYNTLKDVTNNKIIDYVFAML